MRQQPESKVSNLPWQSTVEQPHQSSLDDLAAVQGYPVTHDNATGRCYESATGEMIIDEGLVSVACMCQGKKK
eukprot:328026-Amphidinium_carterae.1